MIGISKELRGLSASPILLRMKKLELRMNKGLLAWAGVAAVGAWYGALFGPVLVWGEVWPPLAPLLPGNLFWSPLARDWLAAMHGITTFHVLAWDAHLMYCGVRVVMPTVSGFLQS